ncbi:MAG: hypothetical protein AB7P69_03485 [Candidatus Binatia bacterium]
MKLSVAYHCHDCQEIFERAPYGTCPRCASHEISALSWLVKSAAEREAWFDRIRGGARQTQEKASRPAFSYSCPTTVNRIEQKTA